MGNTIDQAFISQWEAEHHAAYQRRGSHLRNTVRTSTKTPGQDIKFHKVGTGTASQKTRNGDVPVMNINHEPVTCTLEDWYAGDYIDKLDLLKTNLEERKVVTDAGSWALGRKTDELIVEVLDGATGGDDESVNLSTATKDDFIGLITRLGARDVPVGDGGLFAGVSWEVWGKLVTFQEFANSQWVGPEALPFKNGMSAKSWAGALWFPFSGFTKATNDRKCYAWHMTSIGHGIGAEVMLDVSWVGPKAAWFVDAMMSQGAKLIDDNGIERLTVDESA